MVDISTMFNTLALFYPLCKRCLRLRIW